MNCLKVFIALSGGTEEEIIRNQPVKVQK